MPALEELTLVELEELWPSTLEELSMASELLTKLLLTALLDELVLDELLMGVEEDPPPDPHAASNKADAITKIQYFFTNIPLSDTASG